MSKQMKSVLLNSSTGTDVQYVGGEILIPGLDPIKKTRIVDFSQVNYKVEVPQVVAIGTIIAYTPTGGTRYIVQIGDVKRRNQGLSETPFQYAFTTPAIITDLGVNAAAQREAIHVALVAKINADTSNYTVAATLGGGNGFTITDDAGYFPVPSQGGFSREGASTVRLLTDTGGRGFAVNNIVTTTKAVYASGEGALLASAAPVYDLVYSSLISGYIGGPKTFLTGAIASAGQKYNMFSITHMEDVSIPTTPSYTGFKVKTQQVWVDNGAGVSNANLNGYILFERNMHRGVANKFATDPSAQVDFFDNVILFQGAAGVVPSGTAGAENKMLSDAKWTYNQIGAQTLTTPTPSNAGLVLDQDLAATEGAEYNTSLLTLSPKEFVVGKQDISVFARISATTWANAAWFIGLRTKQAHSSTFAYSNLVTIGSLAGSPTTVSTQGILAPAALVATATGVTLTNAASYTAEILVDKYGVVTCKLNDVVYPVYSVGTTPLVFAQGTILVPSNRYVQVTTSAPVLVISEYMALPSVWKY